MLWACFVTAAKISPSVHALPAIQESPGTKLFMGDVRGIPHLIVEDPSMRAIGCVPWTNVASVGFK